MNSFPVDAVQSALGYRFKDSSLLVRAFTHSSYVNEHGGTSNERCEFLGDCVLNYLVGERLYYTEPSASEGKLSAKRASIVSREPLAGLVDSLGLIRFLRVGAGVNKSAFSQKVRSDLFEAIVGAVYLDGGTDECKALLNRLFYGKVEPAYDYKSELQALAAAKGDTALYAVQTDGDLFVATVTVFGRSYTGKGGTKHSAQIDAARNALNAESCDK